MQTKIIDLNCRDKIYNFNISVVSEDAWTRFAQDVVLERVGTLCRYSITGYRVRIRDNKARVLLCWKDSAYHEFEFQLDEYGRVSRGYSDIISKLWQDIMKSYYGEQYEKELVRLGIVKNQTIQN